MHAWLPWLPIACGIPMTCAIIWRYRTGRWKRPHTFKYAIILMCLAIAMSTTAAVLRLYGK
jgi:hypothetical protein